MDPAFVAASTFALIALGAAIFHFVVQAPGHTVNDRLADLALKVRAAQGTIDEHAGWDKAGFSVFQRTARHFSTPKRRGSSYELRAQMLIHAGFSGSQAMGSFQLIRIGGAIIVPLIAAVGIMISSASFSNARMIFLAAAAIGYMLPAYMLARLANVRRQRIGRELPDIVDLLLVCVEAGLGILEAIDIVGREAQKLGHLLGQELSGISGELATGASFGAALRGLADRTGVEDIKTLAAILIQSEKLGSQMGPALRATSDQMRVKRRLNAEAKAQKVAIKMLMPLVLCILPAMLSVVLGPAVIQLLRTLK